MYLRICLSLYIYCYRNALVPPLCTRAIARHEYLPVAGRSQRRSIRMIQLIILPLQFTQENSPLLVPSPKVLISKTGVWMMQIFYFTS